MQYILTYKWGYRPRETDDKTASDTNCCYDYTEISTTKTYARIQ